VTHQHGPRPHHSTSITLLPLLPSLESPSSRQDANLQAIASLGPSSINHSPPHGLRLSFRPHHRRRKFRSLSLPISELLSYQTYSKLIICRSPRLSRLWYKFSLAITDLGYDVAAFTTDLSLVLSALHTSNTPHLPEGLSPFGVGFIVWTTSFEILETVFPCDGVTPHPAAIWLFAGKEGEIKKWIKEVKNKSPETIIFVQVGCIEVSIPCPYLHSGTHEFSSLKGL
jgi:hypothetical protein